LLNLAEGNGIEYIVAFDNNPDDLVGAKYFFEGTVLSGFRKVFDLKVIDRGLK